MLDRMNTEITVRLKRKARSINLQAARAAPSLALQLRSLAALYETQADQVARGDRHVPNLPD
jgi:hypothetical protein